MVMTSKIRQIKTPIEKQQIAKDVLSQLPDWFGIPEAITEYVDHAQRLPLWAVIINEQIIVGFATVKKSSPDTAEIDVMGILPMYHRQGLGRQLTYTITGYGRQHGYSLLQVKTVAEGHYLAYDKTNQFYQAMGFKKLEIFPTLWDTWNPCQVYVMPL